MPHRSTGRFCACAAASLLLAACAGPGAGPAWREGAPRPAVDGPGDLARAHRAVAETVRDLPKSRIGNAPAYTVFGQRYAVMDSAAGFREEGIASWYGAKFHGRDTSSGEPYDMHLLTAAHKHLPLPTFVRVTRTDSGQSLVVKVNDRGPFVDDRIIDLSYGAAARLDMLGGGTAPVVIEALSTHLQDGVEPAPLLADATNAAPVAAPSVSTAATAASAPVPSAPSNPNGAAGRWIQIGAYRDETNARDALTTVARASGLGGHVELGGADALYRVRFGPVPDDDSLDDALTALASAGVESYTMIPAAP